MIQYVSLGYENEKSDFRFYEKNGSETHEFRIEEPDEELVTAVNNLFRILESKSDSVKDKIQNSQLSSEIERRRQELAELERQASGSILLTAGPLKRGLLL